MSNLFHEKHVKTRKPHRCAYCGKEIPAGTTNVFYDWGIYDGCSFARYTCHDCEQYIDRFWRYHDYECEIDLVEAFGYFMEQIADEPYKPRIFIDHGTGEIKSINCGNCWYYLGKDLHKLPKYCGNCECEIEGGWI